MQRQRKSLPRCWNPLQAGTPERGGEPPLAFPSGDGQRSAPNQQSTRRGAASLAILLPVLKHAAIIKQTIKKEKDADAVIGVLFVYQRGTGLCCAAYKRIPPPQRRDPVTVSCDYSAGSAGCSSAGASAGASEEELSEDWLPELDANSIFRSFSVESVRVSVPSSCSWQTAV